MRLLLPHDHPSADPRPAGTTISIADAYRAPLGRHPNRPWVGLSMVSSIDGSTVVNGRSGDLSSANDSGVLVQLRSIADVIIVGAGTVRGEGYGPPSKVGQRIGVITASGTVDTSTPLFASGSGFVITTEDAHIDGDVDAVRAGTGSVDLAAAIAQLVAIHPSPRFVQAEGGATLNGALLDADLLDEINVTTSPLSVGGAGPRLTSGAGEHAHRYEVGQLAIDDESFVFTRWVRRRQ